MAAYHPAVHKPSAAPIFKCHTGKTLGIELRGKGVASLAKDFAAQEDAIAFTGGDSCSDLTSHFFVLWRPKS